MTVHAVEQNMQVDNVIIQYRDRPQGSESKLNTYSDGFKVLKTIFNMFRNNRPFAFFGWLALILAVIAIAIQVPVFTAYLQTGLVERFPTLIVGGFLMLGALLSLFAGLILETLGKQNRRHFEMDLMMAENRKKQLLKETVDEN